MFVFAFNFVECAIVDKAITFCKFLLRKFKNNLFNVTLSIKLVLRNKVFLLICLFFSNSALVFVVVAKKNLRAAIKGKTPWELTFNRYSTEQRFNLANQSFLMKSIFYYFRQIIFPCFSFIWPFFFICMIKVILCLLKNFCQSD